ncbi:MAG TPA: hypothetical protein VFA97_08850 [Gaiellaceae bacterium]|nr:hypothetical protein [Gaiellaceae bacterium]
MRLRRSPYAKVIDAQLELFLRDDRELLAEVAERHDAYTRAGRTDAEELYGDYVDAVETGTEVLADMRDHYASTLDDAAAEAYIADFNRAVARKLPEFALELENR